MKYSKLTILSIQLFKWECIDMKIEKERAEIKDLLHSLRRSKTPEFFDYVAILIFQYQYKYNPVFQDFCNHVNRTPDNVKDVLKIPFLPVTAFKHHKVVSGLWSEDTIFRSSATTGSVRSQHFVRDLKWYQNNTVHIWNKYYHPPETYCFLGLLPGYLERNDASLVAMADYFMKKSAYSESGFYLNDYNALYERLLHCRDNNIPTVLFGVSFALLDFCESFHIDFPKLIIIETGGLKGRHKDMTREAIHLTISDSFGVKDVHSEYGMTELFSQAYSLSQGVFTPPDVMKVAAMQINDPFTTESHGKTGVIAIIDLWNLDSCSFIQTEDVGIVNADGTFRVLGRLDHSELRGCNLMLEMT
jgi:hypothetical protein